VAEADLVLCCTNAGEPLFDGNLVQNHAVVAAIGSHDPASREVDTTLVQRSHVVIESLESARREPGDLVIPHKTDDFHWDRALTLRDLIVGTTSMDAPGPRLFKRTGMPWQDLALASSIYLRTAETEPGSENCVCPVWPRDVSSRGDTHFMTTAEAARPDRSTLPALRGWQWHPG